MWFFTAICWLCNLSLIWSYSFSFDILFGSWKKLMDYHSMGEYYGLCILQTYKIVKTWGIPLKIDIIAYLASMWYIKLINCKTSINWSIFDWNWILRFLLLLNARFGFKYFIWIFFISAYASCSIICRENFLTSFQPPLASEYLFFGYHYLIRTWFLCGTLLLGIMGVSFLIA